MDTAKDWFDIIYKARNEISHYWRLSTWLNILVMGWLLLASVKTLSVTPDVKTAITIFYLIGYILSMETLVNSYKLYSAIIEQAEVSLEDESLKLCNFIGQSVLKYPTYTVRFLHGVYAALVLYMTWNIV